VKIRHQKRKTLRPQRVANWLPKFLWYPLIFLISAGPGFLKKIKLRELRGSGCLKIDEGMARGQGFQII
jgi:hypothetical protein